MIDSVVLVTTVAVGDTTASATVITGVGGVQSALVFINGLPPRLARQFQPRPSGRPAPFKPGRAR